MRRTLFWIGLGLFAALFATPAVADGLPNTLPATPAMWTVHGPKGTAYLLGSIHILPKNVNWQTAYIMQAMKRADTFVFEIPMDKESRDSGMATIRDNALLPLSTSLVSLFNEQMRNDFRRVIELTHADPTYVVYMRPWLAAMDLEGAESGDPRFVAAEGVDNKVYALASVRKGVHFRALETYALQSRLLMGDGNLSDEMASLRLAFKQILTEHGPNIDALLASWAKGDAKALAVFGPESTQMSATDKKAMFESRNRSWIPEITAMLKERHTYFITVGAGHLVGTTGVPNLLRAAGYTVDGP
ncbi:MAG: TraB/GumN family protein [Rhizomicrobium sp.]